MNMVLPVFVLLLISLSCVKGSDINIDISNYDAQNKSTVLYEHLVDFKDEFNLISVTTKDNNDYGFYILQVHSYVHNVTLSTTKLLHLNTSVNGTNVGLVQMKNGLAFNNFFAKKYSTSNVTALVVVTVYGNSDPIPGGCNLIFETEMAPYQRVHLFDSMLRVDSQAPLIQGKKCENNIGDIEMYHIYLPEHNQNSETYFDGIRSMLTVDAIRRNGRKIHQLDGYYKYKRLYSLYKNTGRIFAIIASYKNGSAAYVPVFTDAVKLGSDNHADLMDHVRILFTLLPILGFFITFFGHKFFRTLMFIKGFLAMALVMYIILTAESHFDYAVNVNIAIAMGIVFGIFWLFVWWHYGIPFVSVNLTFGLAGFLIASIIFYTNLVDHNFMHNDMNFWTLFITVMLGCSILFMFVTHVGHIACCALIGSYACIISFNFYLGGNLQYILVNTIRRATVTNFNLAVVDPPYSYLDIYQTLFWWTMFGAGYLFQMRCQRGRPPFPPPRFVWSIYSSSGERRPLLA